MGNIVNKISEFMDGLDPLSDKNSYPVDCKCHNLAKYRCSVMYKDYVNDNKVFTDYPFLKPYYRSSLYGPNTEYMFVACDSCIGENKNIFTHYPDGWKENIKVAYFYEPANFIQ